MRQRTLIVSDIAEHGLVSVPGFPKLGIALSQAVMTRMMFDRRYPEFLCGLFDYTVRDMVDAVVYSAEELETLPDDVVDHITNELVKVAFSFGGTVDSYAESMGYDPIFIPADGYQRRVAIVV